MKFLTGEPLSHQLRAICDVVKSRLWIAVPYIGDATAVSQLLGSRWIKDDKLDVRLLIDTENIANLNPESIGKFRAVGAIKHLRGLHAKIYIADDRALLTSANLTRTAFARRFEVGTIVDAHSIKSLVNLYESWWEKAADIDPVWFQKNQAYKKKKGDSETQEGSSLPNLHKLPKAPSDFAPHIKHWLTTLNSDDGGEEWLKKALGKHHFYAFGKANPRHAQMKEGDLICFYAAPKGIVAHATIASETNDKKRPDGKQYKEYPWWCYVKRPHLYLNKPVEIDASLRLKLDEFMKRDHKKNWGWFVQVTRTISQHDFRLLTQGK